MEQKLQTTDYEVAAQRLYTGLLDATLEFDALQSILSAETADIPFDDSRLAWFGMIDRHIISARHHTTELLEQYASAVQRKVNFPWSHAAEAADE